MHLSIRAAAEACGVSRREIEQARLEGRFPNARTQGGSWVIPLEDLRAAGFRPNPHWVPREEQRRRAAVYGVMKRPDPAKGNGSPPNP